MKTPDRSNPEVAKGIFEDLAPDSEGREQVGEVFREAIELARREAADRWAITLHRSKVRLNVGWVEALTLFPDELRVICRHDLLPQAIRTDDSLEIVYRPGGIYPR